MRVHPSGDVNAAGIQITQQAGKSTEVREPGAAFLSAFSMKDLQGFLSLFNGLVEQISQGTSGKPLEQPAKRLGTSALPAPDAAKGKGTKPADAKGALSATPVLAVPVRPAPVPFTPATTIPMNLLAVRDKIGSPAGPVTPVAGEAQGANTATYSALPLPHWAVKTSGPTDAVNPQLNLPSDLAFALQLTPQSGKANTDAATKPPSSPNAVPTKAPAALSVLEVPTTDSSKNPPKFSPRPLTPLVESRIATPQPDPSGANSAIQARAALQPLEAPSSIHIRNADASEGATNRGATNDRNPVVGLPESGMVEAAAGSADTSANPEAPVVNAMPENIPEGSSPGPSRRPRNAVPTNDDELSSDTVPSHTPSEGPGLSRRSDTPVGAVAAEPRTASAVAQTKSPNEPAVSADRNQPTLEAGTKPLTSQLANQASQQQHTHDHAGTWDGISFGQPAQPSGSPQTPTKSGQSEAPQRAASLDPVENSIPLQPHPVREISLRVGGGASDPVDVQIAQRAGKVQVAVRTPDPILAKSLQTNLGELVGRLEQRGFRTEAWTPVSAAHTITSVRESWNPGNQSQPGDSGSRGGQQGQHQGQQQSNQRQQERWKAQLKETLSTPNTLTYEEEH